MATPYSVLGILPTATGAEITSAYCFAVMRAMHAAGPDGAEEPRARVAALHAAHAALTSGQRAVGVSSVKLSTDDLMKLARESLSLLLSDDVSSTTTRTHALVAFLLSTTAFVLENLSALTAKPPAPTPVVAQPVRRRTKVRRAKTRAHLVVNVTVTTAPASCTVVR